MEAVPAAELEMRTKPLLLNQSSFNINVVRFSRKSSPKAAVGAGPATSLSA